MSTRRDFFGHIGRPAAAAMSAAMLNPHALPGLFESLAQYPGTPEDVVRVERSYTGQFLKELLERRPKGKSEAAE